MNDSPYRQLHTSRFARVLALAALLCALAIPVVEAGHMHTPADGGSTECLLFKSTAMLPLLSAAPVFAVLFLLSVSPRLPGAVALQREFQPRQTRGPPLHA